MERGVCEGVGDGGEGGGVSEDMDLAGDAEFIGGGARVRDDSLDGDEMGVDERGEDSGGGAFDVADLEGAGVEDFDGVWVVGVVGFTDEADEFAAADGAGVVFEADDVGGDEADKVGVPL